MLNLCINIYIHIVAYLQSYAVTIISLRYKNTKENFQYNPTTYLIHKETFIIKKINVLEVIQNIRTFHSDFLSDVGFSMSIYLYRYY